MPLVWLAAGLEVHQALKISLNKIIPVLAHNFRISLFARNTVQKVDNCSEDNVLGLRGVIILAPPRLCINKTHTPIPVMIPIRVIANGRAQSVRRVKVHEVNCKRVRLDRLV